METTKESPRDDIGNRDSMVEFAEEKHVLPVPPTKDERLQIAMDMAAAQEKAEQAEKDKKAADDYQKALTMHKANRKARDAAWERWKAILAKI